MFINQGVATWEDERPSGASDLSHSLDQFKSFYGLGRTSIVEVLAGNF